MSEDAPSGREVVSMSRSPLSVLTQWHVRVYSTVNCMNLVAERADELSHPFHLARLRPFSAISSLHSRKEYSDTETGIGMAEANE